MWPLLLALSCSPPPAEPPPAANAQLQLGAPRWPAAGAPLRIVDWSPVGGEVWRVFIDPGHGAPGNDGNTGVNCQVEGEQTLRFAEGLASALTRSGAYEIRMGREGDARPGYRDRAAAAEAWPADALISLHTDARYAVLPDVPTPCPRDEGAEGFSVLYSDEGGEALMSQRRSLARALAGRMVEAGFTPYDGAEYRQLYAEDEGHAGVFIDRHAPGQRIFMLRGPSVPSVILELHHALDPLEVARWEEPRTWEAFHAALAAGLNDARRGPAFSGSSVIASPP